MFYNLEPGQTAHWTSLFNILASIKTFVETSNMFVFILIFLTLGKLNIFANSTDPYQTGEV